MIFDGGICLFGSLSLGIAMLWRPIDVSFAIVQLLSQDVFSKFYIGIGPQHQIPEGLGPILRIYDERIHLPKCVINFP